MDATKTSKFSLNNSTELIGSLNIHKNAGPIRIDKINSITRALKVGPKTKTLLLKHLAPMSDNMTAKFNYLYSA